MDETKLIAALEEATGPDQVLEQHIAGAIGWRFVKEGHPIGCVWYDAGGRARALPAFTASIDAALTLVPEGWTAWELRSHFRKTHFTCNLSRLTECDSGEDWVYGRAPTPALAICIAALRAREARP